MALVVVHLSAHYVMCSRDCIESRAKLRLARGLRDCNGTDTTLRPLSPIASFTKGPGTYAGIPDVSLQDPP
ncbi:hypothetical protein APY04_0429 [Hyphomicrobium sulfonivorans]|uniref:Uncharacterized protein n=1 Tax=Hyphomicrobium sulfonivorans TaxID=121290 RepID=A0A109BMK5_HYPSL|nr:hypothetical protein APY04_0429 [Hyphomicrobium sulfonivorans]